MSDKTNAKPTRTLEELSGRRAVIDEEQGFRVASERSRAVIDEGRNITTIDELNRAFLPPDEREKKEQELKDKDGTAKLGKHDSQRRRKPDDKAQIFQEGDIIDWMFKNIIMQSLDWVGNKAVNCATWLVGGSLDLVGSAAVSGGKKCKKMMKNTWDKWNPFEGDFGKYPDDNTTKFRKDIAALHNKDIKDCEDYISDDNFMALMNAFRLAHDGHTDTLSTMMNGRISPQTITMINSLTPAQRQQAFSMDNAVQASEEAIMTAIIVKNYAANMAYVHMLNDKMNNKDQPKKDKVTLYNEYYEDAQNDMITLMAEAREAGKSPEQVKTMCEDVLNLSIEAGKHTDKQIENRNYNEQNGKPDRNKSLEKIEDIMAVTKESPYRNNTQLVDFAQEVIHASTRHEQAMQPIQQQMATLVQWENDNQNRRQNLNAVRQRIEQRHVNPQQRQQQAYQQQGARV